MENNNNIVALEKLIDGAMEKENALAKRSAELAVKDKEFADYLAAKKHNDEELEVLWGMVKQYMEENGITEHETDFIKLKLAPIGKYKAEDIDSVSDDLCVIKRILDNKKVKAYLELNGKLPEGIESMGNRLIKTLKENG